MTCHVHSTFHAGVHRTEYYWTSAAGCYVEIFAIVLSIEDVLSLAARPPQCTLPPSNSGCVMARSLLHFCAFVSAVVALSTRSLALIIRDATNDSDIAEALKEFAALGEDTEIRILRNISLRGVNTSAWPIRGFRKGTVRLKPHPELKAQAVVFLDVAMQLVPMTEQLSGAFLEVGICRISNNQT